jgi:hypothetical protein
MLAANPGKDGISQKGRTAKGSLIPFSKAGRVQCLKWLITNPDDRRRDTGFK